MILAIERVPCHVRLDVRRERGDAESLGVVTSQPRSPNAQVFRSDFERAVPEVASREGRKPLGCQPCRARRSRVVLSVQRPERYRVAGRRPEWVLSLSSHVRR